MERQNLSSVFIWGLFKDKQWVVPTLVKELQGKKIVKVSSGGFYYLALSEKGQVWGWGSAKHNRFGVEGELIQSPKLLALNHKIMEISAGNWHSLIVDVDGVCYATGHNKYGSCGVGSFDNVQHFTKVLIDKPCKMVTCGDGFSLALAQDGQIFSFGHHQFHGHKIKQNINKPKHLQIEGQTFVFISSGFTHSVCVAKSGEVYSWGDSTFNQLGHGNTNHQQQPKKIQKLCGAHIVSAACSKGQKNGHSMAVSESGEVYSWGAGYKGKLGHANQWTHADSADQPLPKMIKNIETKVVKAGGGGIHATLLGGDGGVYSFGCGSNGRLGHIQSKQYKYLYRQGYPKKIDSLEDYFITDLSSSYYHNICVGLKKTK